MAPVATAEASFEEVHAISVDLLNVLSDNGIKPTIAFAAMIMTLGRMASEEKMEPEEEEKFINTVSEWITLYFYKGDVQ